MSRTELFRTDRRVYNLHQYQDIWEVSFRPLHPLTCKPWQATRTLGLGRDVYITSRVVGGEVVASAKHQMPLPDKLDWRNWTSYNPGYSTRELAEAAAKRHAGLALSHHL